MRCWGRATERNRRIKKRRSDVKWRDELIVSEEMSEETNRPLGVAEVMQKGDTFFAPGKKFEEYG